MTTVRADGTPGTPPSNRPAPPLAASREWAPAWTAIRPATFDIDRPDARLHLAFATGPHLCIGLLLARLQTAAAIGAVLARLPAIRLDADATAPSGLIFRKPDRLTASWPTGGS